MGAILASTLFRFVAVAVISAGAMFTWGWNSDRVKEQRNRVVALETNLIDASQALETERQKAESLQNTIIRLESSREKIRKERNNAWAAIGKAKDEKSAFMNSKNLTDTEVKYVECQTVPVPDSRKPHS